jgi:outer membrane receptor protein involved in Fe transport
LVSRQQKTSPPTPARPRAAGCALLLCSLTSPGLVAAQSAAAPAADLVPEVLVTGRKLDVETRIDRKIYSVGADLQSTFGSAADVLSAIPSVEVDTEGMVALRGDTNVLILLDGRPLAQLSGPLAGESLQQLAAQDIERIEVMTNPPAQYKVDGAAGVINIITKKSHRAGLAGQLNAGVGNDGRYALASSGTYGLGALNLGGVLSLRHDERTRQVVSDVAVPGASGEGDVFSYNDLNEHVAREMPWAKFTADYAAGTGQTVSLSVARGGLTGQRFFTASALSTEPPVGPISDSVRNSVGHEASMNSDQRLQVEQKLDHPDEHVTITLHHSVFHEREPYQYSNDYLLPPASPSFDDLTLTESQESSEVSADYVRPFSSTQSLGLGYDYQQDEDTYGNQGANIDPMTGQPTPDPAISNTFEYLQQVNALYGSYQLQSGAWSWMTGLRAEQTHLDVRPLTTAGSIDRSYFRLYPNLHLNFALSDRATLAFSASRRITRPDPSSLDPYVDRQDIQNLRSGDPFLRPQDTQSYELGYDVTTPHLSYDLTGYYRRNRDAITDLTQALSSDVVLTTKANLPKSDSGGLELTSNGQLGTKLSYALSGNLFYSQIDASALGTPGLRSSVGLNAKASIDYRPTTADTVQIAVTRSDKRLTPQGYIDATDQVNLGYRHQLRANLMAVATVTDLFNGQVYRRHVSTPDLSDLYQRRLVGRFVYVGFVFRFGSQKKRPANEFEYAQ